MNETIDLSNYEEGKKNLLAALPLPPNMPEMQKQMLVAQFALLAVMN